MQVKTVALWRFSPDDFSDWQQLVGPTESTSDYAGYLSLLEEAAAAVVQSGVEVVFCTLSVAKMRAELTRRKLDNTSANRAVVIGDPQGPTLRLGLKVGANYIGSTLVSEGGRLLRSGQTSIDNPDGIAGAVRRILGETDANEKDKRPLA